jgi:hypothetical protein
MKHRWPLAGLGIAVALALPALAARRPIPEPKDPGKVTPRPKGPFHTYTVCKRGCDFRKIQAAVNKAKAGDKVKIKSGTYREAVKVDARKSYLRIVGNPKSPRKVVLDGAQQGQNGIFVNGADEVTIDGVMARNYNGNGFFAVNVVGYTMNHLVAEKTGTYGLYAFNSKGGTMENSEAYYVNDGAFYIGRRRKQAKPIRSIVRNVDGWGAPIGFSGQQHALRHDHQEPLLQQRGGIDPELHRLGEVPAGRGQRHRRQRPLLEQLQLPRGRAVQDPRETAPAARRRSAPESCSSAAIAPASRTTGSSATTSAASG